MKDSISSDKVNRDRTKRRRGVGVAAQNRSMQNRSAQNRNVQSRRSRLVVTGLTILFWLAAWEMVYVIVERDYIIPSPLHTLYLLWTMLFSAQFYANVAATMGRVLAGMLFSFAAGALCAVAAYFLPAVRQLLAGVTVTLKSVPVMAVILLAILWLPTDGVPVFVCFLMCYPVVYTNVLSGLDNVDSSYVEMCQVYQVRGKRRFQALYWPSVRPYTSAAALLITGLSWKTVVAAEIFAVPRYSMGYHLLSAKTVLAADQLFAWTIAIVLLSFAFEKAVKWALTGEGHRRGQTDGQRGNQRAVTAAVAAGDAGGSGAADMASSVEEASAVNMASPVEISGVSKTYGDLELYRDFSLAIAGGKVTAITGPSGCGKTTLLRMIAGLEWPDAGTIRRPDSAGTVSFVFQEDRLLPWMTVLENLLLVLPDRGKEQRARNLAKVEQVLRMMGLSDFGDYLPGQLSGGMRRRVAMGRALVYEGGVTLMDEPFTGLDDQLKQQIQQEIGRLWKSRGCTVVFITHDRQDAWSLADQVYELEGRPVVARRVQ